MAIDRISVILPTHSKPHLLREVLEAVLGQEAVEVELIVVLNGVNPQIEQTLADYASRLRVIKNEINLGFAVAMNQGAGIATGKYLYLTANDIVLPRDYLGRMAETAEAMSGWGLLSGVWHNYYNPSQVVGAGGTLRFTPSARLELLTAMRDTSQTYEVDWLHGASIFTTVAVWRLLGGFREDFFAHVEDVELCLRARQAGGYVRIDPSARLYHHEHDRGISSSHTIEFYKLRNYAAIHVLHGPVWGWPWVALKYLLYTVPRIAFILGSVGFYLRTITSTVGELPKWVLQRLTSRPTVVPAPRRRL